MYWLIPYVRTAFQVFDWLIIIRVLLSWIPHNPYNPVLKFIYEITEPVLAPFKKIIGIRPGIDFSPIIAIFALRMVEYLVIMLLRAI